MQIEDLKLYIIIYIKPNLNEVNKLLLMTEVQVNQH